MSSSSATASASRSPSPATPESSDSPSAHSVVIQNDLELSSWYNSFNSDKPLANASAWDNDGTIYLGAMNKDDEQPMLQFDDLIEENAYDDGTSPYMGFNTSPIMYSATAVIQQTPLVVSPTFTTPTQSMSSSDIASQTAAPITSTKPVPPPAARPRKAQSFAALQRIVYPPKESCFNLPIMVPSIPEGGTKSRVETQVRATVDLAHGSSSSGEPFRYDRVGTWKWLKLPTGTATKRRTRKEGKIDATPQDMLYLTAKISCASPPYNPVLSCASCQAREAKRVARKLAARVRPARSDSDSPEDNNAIYTNASARTTKEDTTSIIQFNCPEVLDFSTGSVVLPLRITCYCRHHREKVGFIVHFTMLDCSGRVVGAGASRPIMITDDHKTVNANKQGPGGSGSLAGTLNGGGGQDVEIDWTQFGQPMEGAPEAKAPSKRRQLKEPGATKKRERAKPYNARSRTTSARASREASVVSLTSMGNGSGNGNTGPSTPNITRPATPAQFFAGPTGGMSQMQQQHQRQQQDDMMMQLQSSPGHPGIIDLEPSGISPSDTMHHVQDQLGFTIPGTQLLEPALPIHEQHQLQHQLSSSISMYPTSHYSPNSMGLNVSAPLGQTMMTSQPMPFMFFDPGSPPPMSTLPLPKIHRLIPAAGPTFGGIEVTVLGANFHPAMTLSCVFGDAAASSTQRWSDNTLVCILPPRATAGVVAVWFDGVQKDNDNSPPCIFTYTDESDRALMELALQVVGLKMTGKIEDAKNVAMRIVGNSGADDSQNGGDPSNMMQLASASYRDIRPMLLTRAEGTDFESVIVDFLSILDVPVEQSATPISLAISHTTTSGQTLLHLAAFLGFANLTRFLIAHEVDLDTRDRNGYTALHFAAASQSLECAKLLVFAGADLEIVNALGKTAQEQVPVGFFEDILSEMESYSASDGGDDDESRWGDAEEEDEDQILTHSYNRSLRRLSEPVVSEDEAAVAPEPPLPDVVTYPPDEKKPSAHDEKQTASFVDLIQRTFAQMYASQGIIPNMPQLPLPQLSGMPVWNALPQIPMVFPVFVPMPAWAASLLEKREDGVDGASNKNATDLEASATVASGAVRAAQEWRATCEKWMALAMATATLRQQEAPPPMYTPRTAAEEATAGNNVDVKSSTTPSVSPPSEPEDEGATSSATVRPLASAERPVSRRVGYPSVPITEQDVKAYGYRPAKKQNQQVEQKNDRMLVYFWIPTLLLSLLWALFTGVKFAFHVVRTSIPLSSGLRA